MNDSFKKTGNEGITCMGKIVKYLRELSIVVIGIAITLSINNWLTTKNEKKDMALYLNAVKLELETNLADFEWLTSTAEKEVAYSNYLLSHDKNALNLDSIQFYENEYYSIGGVSTSSNAFEMFKASGSMRLIKDKEALLSIWNAYLHLELMEMEQEQYYNKEKFEESKKEMLLKKEGNLVAVPMYDFYTSPMEYTFELLRKCKLVKSSLEEAIAKTEAVL